MELSEFDSPCIGVCSTTYGDDICRGCKRTYQEVIDWLKLDSDSKNKIWLQITDDIVKVLQDKFEIFDSKKLQSALLDKNIRFYINLHPLSWLWHFFQQYGAEIDNLQDYGVKSKKPNISTNDLYILADKELIKLANKSRFNKS